MRARARLGRAAYGFVSTMGPALAGAHCSILVDTSGLIASDDPAKGTNDGSSGVYASERDGSSDTPAHSRDSATAQDGEPDVNRPSDVEASIDSGALDGNAVDTGASDSRSSDSGCLGLSCATSGCCGSSCETAHSNGVGQTFYDCDGLGTHTQAAAIAACVAYANAHGGNASDCSGDWYCNGDPTRSACFAVRGECSTYCWNYSGPAVGDVVDCNCPSAKAGSWN